MKIRLLSLLVIFFLFGVVFITLQKYENSFEKSSNKPTENIGKPKAEFGQFTINVKDPVWDRENTFINYSLYKRSGLGPVVKTIDEINGNVSSKSKIILLLGDSFVWGDGVSDPNMSIAIRLQDELNSRGKDSYRVSVLAKNGASTYNFVDLLTKKVVDEINPTAIVYAYYINDTIPNFNEKIICGDTYVCKKFSPQTSSTYQNCVNGKTGFLNRIIHFLGHKFPLSSNDLLIRLCDSTLEHLKKSTYDEEYLWANPWENPWIGKWEDSLDILRERFPERNFFISQLYFLPVQEKVNNFIHSRFAKYGFIDVDMNSTLQVLGKYDTPEIRINKVNNHANSILTKAYAEDIASAILNVDSEKGSKVLSEPSFSLISSTVPSNISFSRDRLESKFTFAPDKDFTFDHVISGNPLPKQYTLCAELGYPFIRINLNRFLPSGNITLRLNGSKTYKVGYFYYNEDYEEKYVYLGLVKGSLSFSLPKSNGSSLTIGIDDKSMCSLDKEISTGLISGSLSFTN